MPREPFNPTPAAALRQARENDPQKQAWIMANTAFQFLLKHVRSRHNPNSIAERSLARRIITNQPLSFAAFYGVGPKPHPDRYDISLLQELNQLSKGAAEVTAYEPGAVVHLILADVHGQVNGFVDAESGNLRSESIEYLNDVASLAAQLGMQSHWLSDLYQRWGLSLPDVDQPHNSADSASKLFWGHHARGDHRGRQLVESAARHNHRGIDPEATAHLYVTMRLQERDMLAEEFTDSIFLIHSSKDMAAALLPQNLPHLYLDTRPAWFLVERPG